jgi:hypothetical protein
MSTTSLADAHRLLLQAVDALDEAAGAGGDAELVAVLALCETVGRRLDRVTVSAVAALERRGVFAEKGYKSATSALGDLLGWERFEARRRVTAAERVTPRVGLDAARLDEGLELGEVTLDPPRHDPLWGSRMLHMPLTSSD